MLQALHDHGINELAAFEFFVRKLPNNRNFLLAAGLEQAVEYLETLRFNPEELDWLRGLELAPAFPVRISAQLTELARAVDARTRQT